MEDSSYVERCPICNWLAVTPSKGWLYRDGTWMAQPVMQVPGWTAFCTTEHVEGLWNLSVEQFATFGPLVSRLSKAVHAACLAESVYLMTFGEDMRHFHGVIVPVTPDIPMEWRRNAIIDHVQELRERYDATTRETVETQMRDALERSRPSTSTS